MKKAFLQLHVAVFLAGFTAVMGRLISLNEGMIVWYRLLFTAVTMWILFGATRKLRRIPIKEILKITGVGFIAAMHWVTFYASVKYANASVAVVCFSAIGFFTSLFEPLILKKKINGIEFLLGLLTLGGIYIIFHFDTQFKTGIIIGIISAVLASLFPIYNREFLKKTNVETLLTWELTGGLVTLSILLPFYLQRYPTPNFIPGPEDLGWLLFLSWICSVIAFQLSANALRKLSAFTVNLTYSLEPVYGIIFAFILYHENKVLGKWFYLGVSVIAIVLIIHVIILQRQERKLITDAGE